MKKVQYSQIVLSHQDVQCRYMANVSMYLLSLSLYVTKK